MTTATTTTANAASTESSWTDKLPSMPTLPEWSTRGYTPAEGRQAIGASTAAASCALTGDPMLGAAFALTGALASAEGRTPEALLGAAAAVAAAYAFGPLAGAGVTIASLVANRAIIAITTPKLEAEDVVV